MFDLTASNIIAGLVGLVFIAGAIGNAVAPPNIAADYKRWGYPPSFHYVTAVLEAVAAVLIVLPYTRLVGATLGGLVMVAAIITLIRHKELSHAIAPAAILTACVMVVILNQIAR